ncbi:RE2 [Symbiodinium natans]|uniref:RE2 protein n=1 Tax=Symbiodinium natans TaxID=878477 RepID=A0A812T4Y3_9DINO|nr:RE2 [Symbiodinium natans]
MAAASEPSGQVHDDVLDGQPPPGFESEDRRSDAPERPPEPSFRYSSRKDDSETGSSRDTGANGDPADRIRSNTTPSEWDDSRWGWGRSQETHSWGEEWERPGEQQSRQTDAWGRRASWETGISFNSGGDDRQAWRPEDPWSQGRDPWSTGKNDGWHGWAADDGAWRVPRADPQADGRAGHGRGNDHAEDQRGQWVSWKADCGRPTWPGDFDVGFRAYEERGGGHRPAGRASEKLNVPSFTGEDIEDLGGSARSYLRQVEAWRRMTYLSTSQQGLVLYQNLGGKAWIAAEELSVKTLASDKGVDYLIAWINARFLDLEVARIGRAFSDFFRRLRRKPNQTIREYNTEYDRLHARLREVGCSLPEECAAWLYLDRMQLEEAQELNLLASVGNCYSLHRLQQAAVLHDRGQRKPWEGNRPRKPHSAHITDNADGGLGDDGSRSGSELEDGVPEDVAIAYATYQSAKEKYKEQTKARGYQGDRGEKSKQKGGDMSHEEKVKLMKSRSFCSSCGKKGHWHRDPECPNHGRGVFALKYEGTGLVGITDTACAKSVAGTSWLQAYSDQIEKIHKKPELVRESEAFRFGTGKIHHSSFHVVISFKLGAKVVELKTSIINGDVPLLLSKGALAQMGMVFDVAANCADFGAVGLKAFELITTSSGHPAIPIVPASPAQSAVRLVISDHDPSSNGQYTAFAVSAFSTLRPKPDPTTTSDSVQCFPTDSKVQQYRIFYDKKLSTEVKELLTQDRLPAQSFIAWWGQTKITSDFWLEGEFAWHRMTRRKLLSRCSGLAEVLLPSIACHALLPLIRIVMSAPCPPTSRPPAINKMSKTQLLAECNRLGLVVHHGWSCPEIKAVIMEDRMNKAESEPGYIMKSIAKLNLPELKQKADSLNVQYPSNVTKGALLRLVRESLNTPATELMQIGKFRGYEFGEIPDSYGSWALKEIKMSSNAHPELVRYARWWEENQKKRYSGTGTFEENAIVPFPSDMASDSGTSSSWGVIHDRTSGSDMPHPVMARSQKRTKEQNDGEKMEAESDPQALEEIQALETKLAILKEKAKTGGKGHKGGHVPKEKGAGEEIYEHEGSHFGSKTSVQKGGCCGRDDPTTHSGHFISQEDLRRGLEKQSINYACQAANAHEADAFEGALAEGDFSFVKLEQLLRGIGISEKNNGRPGLHGHEGVPMKYHTFGLFSHGGVFGVTNNTKNYSSVVKYVNAFGRHHLGPKAKWTSVTLTHDAGAEVHHDYNNLRDTSSYVVSLGQDAGGGLWVEDRKVKEEDIEHGTVKWRRLPNGRWLPGRIVDTKENFYELDPFLKHAVEPWTGTRWSLVFHTTRNFVKIGRELRSFLKGCGFPLPGRVNSTHKTDLVIDDEKSKKPGKVTRRTIFNNAAKISVMIATLISAATSYMATYTLPEVEAAPIVIFEIGSTEATEEAVALGKDVFEPMDWETFASPEGKGTAHHIIHGASPKELKVALGGKPDSCNEALLELIEQQLHEGGAVVVEGETSDSLFLDEKFQGILENHTQYVTQSDLAKQVVMYKSRPDRLPVRGQNRVHHVCAVEQVQQHRQGRDEVVMDGSGIVFGEGTPPRVASALRRLHQNLGHPRQADLIRHLRLAGCDNEILKGARSLRCQVCDANVAPRIARPSVVPQLCDWNDTVGVDIFYAHDIDDKKHTFLSVVDYGTTLHQVVRVDGQSSDDIEGKFNELWILPYGPPKVVVADLDGGVQGAIGRLCEWHNIGMRSIAAQSHWQAGMVERQQAWWKNIWEKLVYQLSIGEEEVDIAVPIVNGAKNDLRRRCGHSPSQWVFGRAPRLPEDLQDPDGGNFVTWDVSEDSRFQRQSAMRAAARVAFHQSQVDSRLRKALLQRTRTTPRPIEIGESVHFWHKPKNRRRGQWTGPAVVVGKEGNNYWISNNGRCRLTSPEHIRGSTPEEVGAFLAMKGTQQEVEKLLEYDPDGDEAFEDDDDLISDYVPDDLEMADPDDEGPVLEPGLEEQPSPLPSRRLKRKTAVAELETAEHEAMMLRSDLTRRGVEKRKEKELKWNEIPQEVHDKFLHAERVQWEEHLSYDALQPLTTSESERARQQVPAERILRCRWAYKDKNYSKRREGGGDIPWKCKSRLVIAGHTDPDLGSEFLSTDAPTLSRCGLACLLQLAACGLGDSDPWSLSAGDIKCAFLTGSYLTRELYMHQPKTGFPGMLPGQLVKIKKNVFGLATSPHEWWGDLQEGFKGCSIVDEAGRELRFDQCALDPCIFVLREWKNGHFTGPPAAYVGCHVDDLLVVAPRSLKKKIEEALSAAFPIDSWEEDAFEFLGALIIVHSDKVMVSQEKYAATRLFNLDIPIKAKDEDEADKELQSDNRSLIGALSWLSAQSRPDLTCSVSMAQQLQKSPTIGDLRFTNAIAAKAQQFKQHGLIFKPIQRDRMMFVVFHDAAWANVPEPDPQEDYYVLTAEDNLAGLQDEGPYKNKEEGRKAKKGNSRVASQIGVLVTFVDKGSLNGNPGNFSIADWKSRAGQRVCRSTFGAETQACAEGLETGQYIRSMWESLISGELVTVENAITPILCLSDCRSLYDHLNKQGVPRVPTDKRLAVDLAALRQALRSEMWSEDLPIGWIPGSTQKGDILTKPQSPAEWWEGMQQPLVLPLAHGRGGALIGNRPKKTEGIWSEWKRKGRTLDA